MKKMLYLIAFLLVILIALLMKDTISFGPKPTYTNNKMLNDEPDFLLYSKENTKLASDQTISNRVVFIGNSITQFWVREHPEFFSSNNYIGRGIAGQSSPHLLMRFRQDVIDLKPIAVLINIGTNDVAENSGAYNPKFTLDNIKSMADIATANGIKVILSSVLPVNGYPWRADIKNATELIDSLNVQIKAFAMEKNFPYIDYNTALRNEKGGLIEGSNYDGVHLTMKGYEVMEAVAKPIIDKVIAE